MRLRSVLGLMTEECKNNIPPQGIHCLEGESFMDVYSIYFGREAIGRATVERQGLYYQIECACERLRKEPYRIFISCEDRTTDLGICIPCGSGFALRTKKSVRQIGEGELCFHCDADRRLADTEFYPLDSQKPFTQLSKLPFACLEYRDGTAGLRFTNRSQDLQDSDPSQGSENK